MHSAKGLEFPVVFVAGVEEGLVPYYHEGAPGGEKLEKVEEEKRLFYVAVTRARTELVLTRPLRRLKRQGTVPTIESRFLALMGPENFSALERRRRKPRDPQLELFVKPFGKAAKESRRK